MSLNPHRQRRSVQAGRAQPVRWNLWEVMLLTMSLVMIASPLLATGYALIVPTAAPAAIVWPTSTPVICPDGPCPPPTLTPAPEETATHPTVETEEPIETATATTATTIATTEPDCGYLAPGETCPEPCEVSYPAPDVDPCASPSPEPSPSPSPIPSPSPEPSPEPSPSPSPIPSPSPEPSVTAEPRYLSVAKEALGLNGQAIVGTGAGTDYLYLIRVENAVATPVPVSLTDTFDAGITGVAVLTVENGTCTITERTLSCTMQPSEGQSASVLFRVHVTAGQGVVVPNTAQAVNSVTGETTSGSALGVKIGTVVQPAPSVTPEPQPSVTPEPQPSTPPASPAPSTPPASPAPSTPPAPAPSTPPAPPAPAPSTPPAPAPSTPPAPPAPAPSTPPAPSDPEPVASQPVTPPASEAPVPVVPPAQPAPAPEVPAPPAPVVAEPSPSAVPAPQPSVPQPAAPKPAAPKPAAPTATPKPVQGQSVPTPIKQPAATSVPVPTATLGPTMAPVTTPAPNKPSLRFNLSSDWGQVFVGDTFEYVITLQNVGDAAGGSSPLAGRARKPNIEKMQDIAPINDVVISDELNPLLEIIDATANGMKVTIDGQKVEAKRATLAGGELVTVKIKVRARAIDVSGKMVLNQASLTYKDEADRLFSNIVAVKIVTKDAPTATPAPTVVPTATTPPVEAKSATTPPVEQGTQELPKTSGGAPLGGVMLLGFTMLLRSVRLRRSRTRI